MTVIWLLLVGFLIGVVFLFWFFHKKLMEPFALPLNQDELGICSKIIEKKESYPFLCRWSVKHRKCIFLPCKKLEEHR